MAIDLRGYGVASSVRIGNVLIPARAAEATLARYAHLLFCLNDSSLAPYSLRGTGSAVKLNDRHLLFYCRHQVPDYPPDKIAVSVDDGRNMITASRAVWITASELEPEEHHEICAVEFVPNDYATPSLGSCFFSCDFQLTWKKSEIIALFITGYPTGFYQVDYQDAPGIHVKQIITSGTYNGLGSSGLHSMKMTRSEIFPADGLSGAPVFFLTRIGREFKIGFAGLTVRGSNTSNFIHFVDCQHLFQFFSHPPRAGASFSI